MIKYLRQRFAKFEASWYDDSGWWGEACSNSERFDELWETL